MNSAVSMGSQGRNVKFWPGTGSGADRARGDLLGFLLPAYLREGKSYLTIAIGCTGGRHRSVAVTEELERLLGSRGLPVSKSHRDRDPEAR